MLERSALAVLVLFVAVPISARDNLGIYESWGVFRDASIPRCYAIAKPLPSQARKDYDAFASVATWPRRQLRNQIHIRLSRKLSERPSIRLRVSGRSFELTGGGGDAWGQDRAMDAAIVAAIRSATTMTVSATDLRGRRFSDRYALSGAATAIDASVVACSGRAR